MNRRERRREEVMERRRAAIPGMMPPNEFHVPAIHELDEAWGWARQMLSSGQSVNDFAFENIQRPSNIIHRLVALQAAIDAILDGPTASDS